MNALATQNAQGIFQLSGIHADLYVEVRSPAAALIAAEEPVDDDELPVPAEMLVELLGFAFVDGLRPLYVARRVSALLQAAGIRINAPDWRVPPRYQWGALASAEAAARFRREMAIIWRREKFCVLVPDRFTADEQIAAEAAALVASPPRFAPARRAILAKIFGDWTTVRFFGGTPGALVRTAYTFARVAQIPPAGLLSATDLGKLLGETKAAVSARLKVALRQVASSAGCRELFLPGMKSSDACKRYAAAQRGNTNRADFYRR